MKLFHQKVFYFLCLILVFMMPVFGRILPLIIGLMFLNWLIEGRYITVFRNLFREKKRIWILSFSAFYFLYCIGLLYSKNMEYGKFDLQVKLSLFAFPLMFSTIDPGLFSRKNTFILLKTFLGGCVAGSLLFYGHALFNPSPADEYGSFYYSNLSWFFHPSYLAMYFSFAISILAYFLLEDTKGKNRYKAALYVFLVFYFLVFIILLSSKAAILGVITTALFWISILIFKKRRWKTALGTLLITILSFYAGLKIFPFATERIAQAKESFQSNIAKAEDLAKKSTSDRISIWKASSEIIRKHMLYGVGTGDVKDELLKEYKIENVTEGFQKKLNAHNQYVQTFVALGIIGFLLLLGMLVLPAWMSIRLEHYLYFSFLLIFGLNIGVESMFETQAGVVFYAFFNVFLFTGMYFPPVPASGLSEKKTSPPG